MSTIKDAFLLDPLHESSNMSHSFFSSTATTLGIPDSVVLLCLELDLTSRGDSCPPRTSPLTSLVYFGLTSPHASFYHQRIDVSAHSVIALNRSAAQNKQSVLGAWSFVLDPKYYSFYALERSLKLLQATPLRSYCNGYKPRSGSTLSLHCSFRFVKCPFFSILEYFHTNLCLVSTQFLLCLLKTDVRSPPPSLYLYFQPSRQPLILPHSSRQTVMIKINLNTKGELTCNTPRNLYKSQIMVSLSPNLVQVAHFDTQVSEQKSRVRKIVNQREKVVQLL